MEFEKLLKGFTISVVVILLITTLVAAGFVVVQRAENNLGDRIVMENNENS